MGVRGVGSGWMRVVLRWTEMMTFVGGGAWCTVCDGGTLHASFLPSAVYFFFFTDALVLILSLAHAVLRISPTRSACEEESTGAAGPTCTAAACPATRGARRSSPPTLSVRHRCQRMYADKPGHATTAAAKPQCLRRSQRRADRPHTPPLRVLLSTPVRCSGRPAVPPPAHARNTGDTRGAARCQPTCCPSTLPPRRPRRGAAD